MSLNVKVISWLNYKIYFSVYFSRFRDLCATRMVRIRLKGFLFTLYFKMSVEIERKETR